MLWQKKNQQFWSIIRNNATIFNKKRAILYYIKIRWSSVNILLLYCSLPLPLPLALSLIVLAYKLNKIIQLVRKKMSYFYGNRYIACVHIYMCIYNIHLLRFTYYFFFDNILTCLATGKWFFFNQSDYIKWKGRKHLGYSLGGHVSLLSFFFFFAGFCYI